MLILVLWPAADQNLLCNLFIMQHALERAGAELRVEASFAQVVEHVGAGFQVVDAGFLQALLKGVMLSWYR